MLALLSCFFISFIISCKCEEIYILRKVVLFFEMGLSTISLFFEKSVITIVDGAKHLPITAGVSCFPEYYERRFFYDNL